MYIHLGLGTVENTDGLIGIFDIEKTTSTKRTREFLAASQKKKEIVNVIGDDFPKSFAVFSKKGKNTTYIIQLAPSTIKKRIRKPAFSEK